MLFRSRLLQDDLTEIPLTLEQRDKLALALESNNKRTFTQIRKIIGLSAKFNLEDEKRILNDERAKRLFNLFGGQEIQTDLHDEKTNRKLLSKGQELSRDLIEKLRARDLKRMRVKDKDPRLNEQIDEIEEMTSRQIAVLEKITDEKIAKLQIGRAHV